MPALAWALSALAADPAGDTARGRAYFQQNCAVCHATTAGPDRRPINGQGPDLAGIVGHHAASVPGFSYSSALADSGIRWDASSLDRFLANPARVVPGTVMVVTVPGAGDRADVIAFLSSLQAPTGGFIAPGPGERAENEKPDAADWRHASPGVRYSLSSDMLPAPYGTSSAGNRPQVVKPPADARLAVPDGFSVRPFAAGLSGPRILQTAPNGDIFVAETRANRIRVLRPAPGSATPAENRIFAKGLDRPFGIAFFPAGNDPRWVYIANNNSVIRIPYRNGDTAARGAPEVVVPKLAETTGGHTTRDIAFSPDGRRLFISVGSGSNVAESIGRKSPGALHEWQADHGFGAAWDSETNRADILVTDPEGNSPLRTFATGIRNPVALAVNPATGDLWTSTNERDGLGDDLVPDYVTRVREGGFYGWPWYYLGSHEDPRHAGARPDLAGAAIVPDVLVQAHSAALGITFYPESASGAAAFPPEFRGDLFVALHGSWNRHSRTGYKVIRVLMKDGIPTGDYEDFLTGFVVDSRSVWGRPVGVTVAADGALLVSEDGNGTIWRVARERRG